MEIGECHFVHTNRLYTEVLHCKHICTLQLDTILLHLIYYILSDEWANPSIIYSTRCLREKDRNIYNWDTFVGQIVHEFHHFFIGIFRRTSKLKCLSSVFIVILKCKRKRTFTTISISIEKRADRGRGRD